MRARTRRPRSRKSLIIEELERRVQLTGSPAYVLHGLDFSPYIIPGEDPNKGPGQITDQQLLQRMQAVCAVHPVDPDVQQYGGSGECRSGLRTAWA